MITRCRAAASGALLIVLAAGALLLPASHPTPGCQAPEPAIWTAAR